MTRRTFLAALLALALVAPALHAQSLDLTARGSGPYVVYVDGEQYSSHVAEREAIESVSRALAANPGAEVHYVHAYVVDARLVGAPAPQPDPTPDPTPDPAPDPTPDPTPDPGPTPAVAWESTWSSGLGTSQAALRDGGKWTGDLCDMFRDTHGAVVQSPAGFPTSTAFRSLLSDVSKCYMLEAAGQWRIPAVGEYKFERFYYRLEAPQGFNPGMQHFYHHGVLEGSPYETWYWLDGSGTVNAAGEFVLTFVLEVNQGRSEWAQVRLRTHTNYRIETRQHRVTANEVLTAIRIYDAAGALVYDTDDFVLTGGSGSSLAAYRVTVANPTSHFGVIQLGYNGSGVQPNIGTRYAYYDAVAVRISPNAGDWIGPYGGGQ